MLLCVALLTLPGCKRYRWDTPNEAFLSFLKALERDERQVVLGALSQGTREALEARARQVEQAAGGLVRSDVESLFFGLPLPSAPISEVRLVEEAGDRATVTAAWGGTTRPFSLVREGREWKLDFTPSLGQSPDTAPDSVKDAGVELPR